MDFQQLQEKKLLKYLYENWSKRDLLYGDLEVEIAPYIGDNKEFKELIDEFDKEGYLNTGVNSDFDKKTMKGINRIYSISYKGIQYYKHLTNQEQAENNFDNLTSSTLNTNKNIRTATWVIAFATVLNILISIFTYEKTQQSIPILPPHLQQLIDSSLKFQTKELHEGKK